MSVDVDEASLLDEVRSWRMVTQQRLEEAGHAVVAVPIAERAVTGGFVGIEPNSAGSDIVVGLADKLHAQVVLIVDRIEGEDDRSIVFHLVGSGSWVEVMCLWGPVDDDDDEEDLAEPISDARRRELGTMMRATVEQMLAEDAPKDHAKASRVTDEILGRMAALGLTDRELGTLYFASREAGAEALEALKDAHRERLHTEAERYAEEILRESDLLKTASVEMMRSAAYRYMKRLDPKCVSRSEMVTINSALEVLVRRQ